MVDSFELVESTHSYGSNFSYLDEVFVDYFVGFSELYEVERIYDRLKLESPGFSSFCFCRSKGFYVAFEL